MKDSKFLRKPWADRDGQVCPEFRPGNGDYTKERSQWSLNHFFGILNTGTHFLLKLSFITGMPHHAASGSPVFSIAAADIEELRTAGTRAFRCLILSLHLRLSLPISHPHIHLLIRPHSRPQMLLLILLLRRPHRRGILAYICSTSFFYTYIHRLFTSIRGFWYEQGNEL